MNRYLKNILIHGRAELIDFTNRLKSNKAIFEGIYKKGGWHNDESVSGSGSTLRNTKGVIKLLPVVFQRYNIKSVLDIPCGDFNWMKEVSLEGIRYHGCDVVENIVIENQRKFTDTNKIFFASDITKDDLPAVDLIFCRDCLPHFSDNDIRRALKNIVRSGSRYLLTTIFPSHKNHNIVTGNWRPLNLMAAPFNLPEPIEIFPEQHPDGAPQYQNKSLALWSIESLMKHNCE